MEEMKIAEQPPVGLQADAQAPVPGDGESFDTLDYVKELFLNSLEQKKADKKKIRLMRFCAVCMAVIAVTLIIAVVAAGPYIRSVVSDFHAITQKITAIDMQALTDNAQKLMADANVTIKSAGATLEALDMDALNSTIKDLGEKVDAMDMESLNSAIESLNEVVTKLSNFRLFG